MMKKKRTVLYIFLVLTLVLGFYFLQNLSPVMAIAGRSMEPTFRMGDVIFIKTVLPQEVKEGDIIVFDVPPILQKTYNYPPVVTHRVIKADASQEVVTFRTKGDNTGEDPFTVLATQIRGTPGIKIPYVGFLQLYLQSRQGFIFLISLVVLLGFYFYGEDIDRWRKKLQNGFLAPIVQQNEALAQRQEQTSQIVSSALEQFAGTMSEYAQHLASHTAAIKDLASASQELKECAAKQNEVLMRLLETMGEPKKAIDKSQALIRERDDR